MAAGISQLIDTVHEVEGMASSIAAETGAISGELSRFIAERARQTRGAA